MILWFFIGFGFGIGVSCLLYCLVMLMKNDRQKRNNKLK